MVILNIQNFVNTGARMSAEIKIIRINKADAFQSLAQSLQGLSVKKKTTEF